jgi:dipeptidyl aminopeptidase/acylaminoacyl peptidase
MSTKAKILSIFITLGITLACAVRQVAPPTPASENLPPTVIVVITNTPDVTPTASIPALPGSVIYDDGENILSIDPNTGISKVLLSRTELETALAKDRSAESYTYGAKTPFAIKLSPDQSKALITICSDLDARYRCLFSDHIYTLDTGSSVKLPVPPDAYGVYWQWSPDGSKLAGAAWSYNRALYYPIAFFAVDNDGANLNLLDAVVNDRWQFAWSPAGGAIHPFSYMMNFKSVFADKSKPQDVSIAGLDGNDAIECLAFSPDGAKVVFSVRRNTPKDHEWVYLANSDFTEATQLTEYDIDSRYFCKVNWSPNGQFVHMRYEYDNRAETGEDPTGSEPRADKLINVETSSLLETPKSLPACGWTPDSNLIYETKTHDGGIQVLTPGTNTPVELPAGLSSTVLHCPLSWATE